METKLDIFYYAGQAICTGQGIDSPDLVWVRSVLCIFSYKFQMGVWQMSVRVCLHL